MTVLYGLTEQVRHMITLWSFLLCVFGIAIIVYAVYLRRYVTVVWDCLLFGIAYVLWQVMVDYHLDMKAGDISGFFLSLPWAVWVVVLTAETLTMVFLILSVLNYEKKFITPNTIKLCADRMPCGICYWRGNGRIIFSNSYMNQLCASLTNRPLLNGKLFCEALPDGFVSVNGRTWRFVRRERMLDDEQVYELMAFDITEEYNKTEILQKDMAEISRINRELQEHRMKMEETVRKQEILQAKINIHDEMNRLMLRTVICGKNHREELNDVFSQWKQNALLLCIEAKGKQSASDKCEELAEQMGIRLVVQSSLPMILSEQQRELFYITLREAVINAVKHGDAKTLTVSFEETDTEISCIFENDGEVFRNAEFTGGLANLSLLAKEQNASITVNTEGFFRLAINFSKKK